MKKKLLGVGKNRNTTRARSWVAQIKKKKTTWCASNRCVVVEEIYVIEIFFSILIERCSLNRNMTRENKTWQRHDGTTATETPISALLLYGRDKAEATCVSPQRTSECNGALPPARGRRRTHYSENYNKKKEKERSTTYGRGAEGKGKGKKQMITRKKKQRERGRSDHCAWRVEKGVRSQVFGAQFLRVGRQSCRRGHFLCQEIRNGSATYAASVKAQHHRCVRRNLAKSKDQSLRSPRRQIH